MAVRQPQTYSCPASFLGLYLDTTVVLLHDLLDHRQPQSDPEALRAEQRLEYLPIDIWWYARTRILEHDPDAAITFLGPHGEDTLLGASIFCAFPNHRLTGIVENVDDGATETVFVEGHSHVPQAEVAEQRYLRR